jgi:hypothetical protein
MKKYDLRFCSKDKVWKMHDVSGKQVILSSKLKSNAMKRAGKWMKENHTSKSKPGTLRICTKAGKYQLEWTYPQSADPKKYKS